MAESNGSEVPGKDKWDIIEVLARPVSAAMTALAIAAIGYFGNSTITTVNNLQEETRAKIAAREQDARLYTQLLTRREESESALRKDMFKEVMDGFFSKVAEDDIDNGISKKILKLEMLALNFGDSLSIGPLFSETSADIDRILGTSGIQDWKTVSARHQKRLQGLARRVAAAQLSAITPKGQSIRLTIPFEKIEEPRSGASKNPQYVWPFDHQGGGDTEIPDSFLSLGTSSDSVTRSITIELRNANLERKSVQVTLIIENMNEINVQDDLIRISFKLDYFNFPLIDNTRLSNNERFAIILEDFNTTEVIIKGILFPGIYASQRDKPYLNEAIQDLNKQQDAFGTPDEKPGTSDSNQSTDDSSVNQTAGQETTS